ncbi:MAG: dephospho-CoA kinase [Bacteroidetes bacterium]|nr:dephospho-CoA kinase [Bacteroidota bacterium]
MLKIGLTGGIGSGKTTVTQIFKILGIPVFDADTAAKEAMENNPALKEKLVATFGAAVFVEHKLNRKYLADIVFNDAYQLNALNALVHPITIAAAADWFATQNSPYVIKEAALMFEAGAGVGLDYVIGVFAPTALRIKRVMDRDHLSREEVLSRMNRQIDDQIKMKLCDFIIQNDNQALLTKQVLELHEKFLKLSNTNS